MEDKAEFENILLRARTCVFIDSRREPMPLLLMVFDDAMLCADYFFAAIKSLMEWSADRSAYFVVLEPHPIDHFHRLYHKYPVLEIARDDSAEAFLAAMDEDVGDGQSFSLCNLSTTWVIVPPSNNWFIHAMRSDDANGGHLWTQGEWVQKLLIMHPGVFRESNSPCDT